MEDYGVVPGLGNLHFRLAYNSAFMPLQALFSFKWLFGQSLHTMNGLFTVAMMAFAVLKSDNNEKSVLRLSDLLKLGAFLYIFYDGFHVSSPNTDTMALILGYYILIKWAEYAEDDNCDIRKYAYLCVLLVYTATLKLSVGILVMLVVFPAYYLIDHKEWKAIFKHISLGIIVICPFLIRNVIISGYWLYPYEATKVGNFDWTMSKTVLQGDRAEIVAWGRGNQDITRNGEHIWQWIGEWYLSIHLVWKVMIIISLISLIYILIHALQKRERIFTPSGWLVCVCIIGPLFWLLTAPLPRYGIIYMIMLPCIALAKLMDDRPKLEKIGITAKRDISRLHFVLIGIYIVAFTAYMMYTDVKIPGAFMQGDYDNREVIIDSTLGVDIATPVNGDQTGYEQFPSAPYKGIISGLELRGEDLSEGFKLR
ncbi:MAG: hypothetical protein K6G69_02365 [Lachnospiraceae bacterium]|nr:hypothetical protein [Lachnospiraceae bacterium]